MTDPDTSKAAALIAQTWSGTLCQKIYDVICTAACMGGGLTQDDVILVLDGYAASITPRFAELVDAGYIRDSGHRRKSRRHVLQIVWIPCTFQLELGL